MSFSEEKFTPGQLGSFCPYYSRVKLDNTHVKKVCICKTDCVVDEKGRPFYQMYACPFVVRFIKEIVDEIIQERK